MDIKPEPTVGKEIIYSKYNVTTARISKGDNDGSKEASVKPIATLASISSDYLVTLTFSEPLLPITDLSKLQKSNIVAVYVDPLDGQTDSDVEF